MTVVVQSVLGACRFNIHFKCLHTSIEFRLFIIRIVIWSTAFNLVLSISYFMSVIYIILEVFYWSQSSVVLVIHETIHIFSRTLKTSYSPRIRLLISTGPIWKNHWRKYYKKLSLRRGSVCEWLHFLDCSSPWGIRIKYDNFTERIRWFCFFFHYIFAIVCKCCGSPGRFDPNDCARTMRTNFVFAH